MVDAPQVQITVLRGRSDECRAIQRLLDSAAGSSGGALLFHGPPGSGRTALLYEAHRRSTGATILAGAGCADEVDLPYAGLHRLLAPVRDRVAHLPQPHRRLLDDALAGGGCPDNHRLALVTAVLCLVASVARDGGLLCTFDDLDAGDRPTAAVLALVARRLTGLPVAVVLTATGDCAAVTGIPGHRLRPLDDRESRDLLADRLSQRFTGRLTDGHTNPVAAHVLTNLTAVGRGNPLALTDLAAALRPGQSRGEEPPPDAIPADGNLGSGYRARLARLPAGTRRLLLIAALDEGLDPQTLARAADAAGTRIDALAPAELSGLIRIDRDQVTFPQPLARAMIVCTAPLADRHAAHRLLAGLLDRPECRLRRSMHLAAAAVRPDADLAEELDQAVRTGDPDCVTAAVALHLAGQLSDEPGRAATRLVAAAGFAWAAGQPERARQLLRELPDPAEERGSVAGRADLLRAQIQLRCGSAARALPALLAAAGRLDGHDRRLALTALVGAGEAICYSGDQYRYLDVERRARQLGHADDSPGTELLTAHLTGVAAALRGEHARAGPALRRVVALGARVTGPARTTVTLTCAAAAAQLLAADHDAHRLADQAVELARDRGDRSGLTRALELRAGAEYWLGRHRAAAASAREGLRIARLSGQRNWAAIHLGLLAVLAAIRADRVGCLDRIDELRELDEPLEPYCRPRALREWALAVLDLVDGRAATALARLEPLACPATGRGQVLVRVMATPYLVEAATQVPEALPVARAALEVFDCWAQSTANPARRALAARCRALLAPRGGEPARNWFRTALRLHPAGAGAFERARTELLFGRELRRSRCPRVAREHLHRAHETFCALGLSAWAVQAAAELRAAGEAVAGPPGPSATTDPFVAADPLALPDPLRTSPPGSDPDRIGPRPIPVAGLLTKQQLQIAQLVAEGATNREVARRLYLSTRTVDHHLRNVFVRLGIRSRTELVRALSQPTWRASA